MKYVYSGSGRELVLEWELNDSEVMWNEQMKSLFITLAGLLYRGEDV